MDSAAPNQHCLQLLLRLCHINGRVVAVLCTWSNGVQFLSFYCYGLRLGLGFMLRSELQLGCPHQIQVRAVGQPSQRTGKMGTNAGIIYTAVNKLQTNMVISHIGKCLRSPETNICHVNFYLKVLLCHVLG